MGKKEIIYDYYDIPYTSFYSPARGPTNGGTQMKVEGFGFRLRRPHLVDNFWVRFVDTDGNQLTNSTTKIAE